MHRIFCQTLCALVSFALIFQGGFSPAQGGILDGLGAIGAESSSGGPTQYAAVLQDHRGLNFGGPGLPYAYGHVGADSASVLQPGNQVDQLVAEVNASNITLATIFNGNNDYIDVADDIIDGTLSGPALSAYQAQVEANIEASVSAVQTAGGSVVLGGLTNLIHSPAAAAVKADPVARAAFEGAVLDGKNLTASFALSQGIPFIDFFALISAIYDEGIAEIGGVELILTGYDDSDPHYFWEDPFHPGTLVNGAIANLFIQAINEGYGTSIPILSDLELLELAGLEGEYVEETFAVRFDYADFVSVPEPSTMVLALFGLAVVAVGGRGRITRRRTAV